MSIDIRSLTPAGQANYQKIIEGFSPKGLSLTAVAPSTFR